MAKKRSQKVVDRQPRPGKKRYRRSDEEMIEDLERKLEEIKVRQEARQLKESPAVRSALGVVRAIDRALAEAANHNETVLRHVLADCRRPIADYLESTGLRLPRARLPRGRRPKGAQQS